MADIITAADLRAYYNADPKRIGRLSPEAARTVTYDAQGRSPKGRIHPEAFSKARGKVKAYTPGNTAKVKAQAVSLRAQAVAAGAGKRGPISKAVLASLKG